MQCGIQGVYAEIRFQRVKVPDYGAVFVASGITSVTNFVTSSAPCPVLYFRPSTISEGL